MKAQVYKADGSSASLIMTIGAPVASARGGKF